MPRAGQIIPPYVHPSDSFYLNDNTEYNEYTADASGIQYLCIYASPKGRDNKLMKFNNVMSWVNEHGYPNFRLYGQAGYIPYILLYNGLANVTGMRVMPQDATYSNLILVVGYKIENGKFKVKFNLFSRSNLRVLDDLETIANSMETLEEDEDGYRYLPLMTWWSLGKGIYGNDYRIRISHDKGADRENTYKNYNIDILSTEKGASLIENYGVTFYIEATDPYTRISNYIQDVITDEDGNGSTRIGMQFFYDNYVKLFEKFKEAYYSDDESNNPTVQNVTRMPALTLPSSEKLYNLKVADGSYVVGLYVYDDDTGMFSQSSYLIEDVAELPQVADASANTIYRLTADMTGATPRAAGTMWIKNELDNWVAAPEIEEVNRLPNTTLYTTGVVYHLTADDGNKEAGSEWIYSSEVNDFVAYVAPAAEEKEELDLTIETFDIFGYNRITEENNEYLVIDGGLENVGLFDIEGVAFANGSDGSFGTDQPDTVRQEAINQALIAAYQGDTDRMIMSKTRFPIHIAYDCNFDVLVKKAMVSLVTKREDFALHLDTGLVQTIADVRTVVNTYGTLDSYLISIDSGTMKISDPITGKKIPVSITAWMADAYPVHVRNYGWHTPFAGERYAIITGYTSPKTVKPVFDEELDAELLEELYTKHRVNYIETIDETTFVRGTQITTQKKYTDLSKENNVMLMLELKRRIERLVKKNRYNWTESTELQIFKSDCEQIFSSYAGSKCRSLTIDVQQNSWERTRYILHVYLAVVFKTYQERGIIELDINPRA